MISPEATREIRKLEDLIKEIVSRTVDLWIAGEGDMSIEVRDGDGERKAKIGGGPTRRIR